MIRIAAIAAELVGFALLVIGAYLFNPPLGLVAGGAVLVWIGYEFEDVQ